MVYIVGLLAAVLLVLTLVVLNRMSVFTKGFASPSASNEPGLANKINAALLPIVFVLGSIAGVWSFMEAAPKFLPDPSSTHGKEIDTMFWWFMGIVTTAFFLTSVLLFAFSFKYQYNPKRRATFYPVNHRLELAWTVIPAIIMAIMVFMGWRVWRDITTEAPADAYVIEVTGKQFNWIARYPGVDDNKLGSYNYKLIDATNEVGIDLSDEAAFDDVISNTLYLPKGVPVLLKIRARDVLHSVFLPHLRVKMDAVPGMPTKFWFTATKTTDEMKAETNDPKFEYRLNCTEICGQGHFSMKMNVVVLEEDDFKAWLKTQKSFLATNTSYLDRVPARLKAKAMKYTESAEEAPAGESAPEGEAAPADSTAAASGATASLR